MHLKGTQTTDTRDSTKNSEKQVLEHITTSEHYNTDIRNIQNSSDNISITDENSIQKVGAGKNVQLMESFLSESVETALKSPKEIEIKHKIDNFSMNKNVMDANTPVDLEIALLVEEKVYSYICNEMYNKYRSKIVRVGNVDFTLYNIS